MLQEEFYVFSQKQGQGGGGSFNLFSLNSLLLLKSNFYKA